MRSLLGSAVGHLQAAALWRMVRLRAAAAGIDPAELTRIRRYLRVAAGVEDPRYMHPHQRPIGYIEGLAARPWHDPDAFSCPAVLEQRHQVIRRELLAVAEADRVRKYASGLVRTGAWGVFTLHSLGSAVVPNIRRCPETSRAIEDAIGRPSALGLAYLSALAPGTHIAPHCGHTNARVRVHLGLAIPQGCELRVGSTTRTWEEGKCIVFDDSFEHEVWNSGTTTRYVLVVDLWHPDLSDAEIFALREIMQLSVKARRARSRTRRSALRS